MPESNTCFGECLKDGFYVEGKSYFDVQEKLEKHETDIDSNLKMVIRGE
jgi:hypothetical protein